jgi:endonuclease G
MNSIAFLEGASMNDAKKFSNFGFALFLGVSFSISNAFAKVETVLGKPLNQNDNLGFQIPTTDNPEIMISRDQYVISYNKDHRSPNWVAWKLEESNMGSSGRTNVFSQDSDLENYLSQNNEGHAVQSNEYSGSCFDRGHQVPSADRTDTKSNNEMTFMMSNMIPQTPYLNRVIWEHLESYARTLVRNNGKKLYVIAGPIYDADFGMIGPNHDIPVPSKDFKIIFVLNADQTAADINANTEHIAVIMPNTQEDGTSIQQNKCGTFNDRASRDINDWQKYQTSVADIEAVSGLHFAF